MADVYGLMIELIRFYMFHIELSPAAEAALQQEALSQLYTLSHKHDLAHIVGAALEKKGIVPQDEALKERFDSVQMTALFRYQAMMREQFSVYALFEKNGIPFLPLKGAVLRDYYPEPWMRTSCDMDILIHETDLETAVSLLMEQLSYQSDAKKGSHDISLFSPSKVHLELHYTFYEQTVSLDEVWETSTLAPDTQFQHVMTDEMFYCYHLAHMAKHFESGGCGVRPFLDMRILRSAVTYNEETLQSLLEKGGLSRFRHAAEALSDVWFADTRHTELTQDLQDYILQAGAYGTLQNKVAIAQKKQGGKFRYALSRIFLPYEVMIYHYPSIEGHKGLLLFYNVRRWGKLLFKGGAKRSLNELTVNQQTDTEKQKKIIHLLNQLGI